MPKILIGLALGLVLGGVITFLTFVGVPRASQSPGAPIQPPDPAAGPASAQIVLGQDLFNKVLETIFRDINEPTFPLAGNQDPSQPAYERAGFVQQPACEGTIRIKQEGSGVRSGVKLDNGRIAAPLAFTGSYNSPFGCLQFTGWAQAGLELRFDKEKKAVYGRLDIETVNLDGVNPLLGGLITPLVQSTINTRVNPIQIINPGQLAVDMPVASTGGKLQAQVEDVRAEVKDNALNLHVFYSFRGSQGL